MKQGWEYKKWNEVLTIINGKNQSAVEDTNGEFPIYGSGGIMGYANNWLCPENCVIIGRKGNINKPIFVKTKFWNVDTAFGLNANKEYLLPKYLFYFCLDYNFERHNKAVTIPSLTKADLLKIQIPLPPKTTQLSIVSELDKINELIRLKKEQLKDYDNLAQSIFYEMFGDPVENEKGWEVKKLSSLFKVSSSKRIMQEEWAKEGVPFLKVSDIVSLIKYGKVSPSTFISKLKFKKLEEAKMVPTVGDILITSRGTLGLCYIIKTDDKFYFQDGMVTWLSENTGDIIPIYITYVFSNNHFLEILAGRANKSTVSYISIKQISQKEITVPPLPLQHLFAQRIEQIERQKSAIQKSITDLETLLASRMQYWFE